MNLNIKLRIRRILMLRFSRGLVEQRVPKQGNNKKKHSNKSKKKKTMNKQNNKTPVMTFPIP